MSVVTIGTVTVALMLILILLGTHVGVALALMSIVGIFMATGSWDISLSILHTTAFRAIREYVYGVIPLFVLMGLFANLSGASQEIYNAFHVLLRRIRGGLGMATVGANALFATITGVSIASAAVFSKISLKPMMDLNYNKRFALGTIAGSSVLGMLIPPSLLLIIYGMLAQTSIGDLFLAGIIPGILLSLVYCVGIYVMARVKPSLVGGDTVQKYGKWTKEDMRTIVKPWGLVVLVLVVLGGIYGGFFTPTEAGGVGAFGALLLVLAKKRFTLKGLWRVLVETGYTTASVLLLLVAAQMYSRMLSLSGLGNLVQDMVASINVPGILIIFLFVGILLLLGMILDSTSILLLTMPLMVPIVSAMGYDLIWFGIISVIATEMGLLTPPFGMVVFAMKSALGNQVTLEELFRGSFPFLVMMFITLLILIFIPDLVTFLPNLW
ncbi:MAG: hypothetical protein BAA02_12515 [Paenibacillaceae bacterium ZCTH02-B3]|nr:MAG: hypothetical protein BAA02_12515 [Paenibacillaceae bacterium ZCTH02-B3]